MVVLDFCCYAGFLSLCDKRGATLSLWSMGSRACRFQQLCLLGSRVWVQELWCTGTVPPWHVESSQTGIKPVSPALAGGFFTTEPPWNPPLQLLDHPTFISFAAIHWPSSQSPCLVPVVVGWGPCLDVYLGKHWVSVSEKGNERVRNWMRERVKGQ